MRVVTHRGRKNKTGQAYKAKHNDRNFDTEKAEHINKEKQDLNIYYHCFFNENPTLTFEEAELLFYKNNFNKALEETNKKYIKNRHKERVKTIEEIYKDNKKCPEEIIFQIGKKGDNITKEQLQKIMNEYLEWQYKNYGTNISILSYALHVDEAGGIHVHLRQVYYAKNEKGMYYINESKALKELGIERPEPTKKEGRYNNAKITFTGICRNKFIDICRKNSLSIDNTKNDKEVGLELDEWKRKADEKKIEEMKMQAEAENIILQNTLLKAEYKKVENEVLEEKQKNQDLELKHYKQLNKDLTDKYNLYNDEKTINAMLTKIDNLTKMLKDKNIEIDELVKMINTKNIEIEKNILADVDILVKNFRNQYKGIGLNLQRNKIQDAYKITKCCFDEILKIDKIEKIEDVQKLNNAISVNFSGGGSPDYHR